jgi:hypothetical protein
MISDRRRIASVPALDVKDPGLADTLASLPMSQVDSGLDKLELEPKEKIYDLKPNLRLHFGEFLRHHSVVKDSGGWGKQFKLLLPGVVGDATLMMMGDLPVATFRRDTKLAVKKLEQEQPQIIKKYTVRKVVEVFDEEAFRRDDPLMHQAYRGRSFRLVNAGAGAGLVLPA